MNDEVSTETTETPVQEPTQETVQQILNQKHLRFRPKLKT